MFRFFKPNSPIQINKLFLITLHIERGTSIEMPVNLIGAYVPIFVGAVDQKAAVIKTVSAISNQGFRFLDIADGKVHELDPQKWDSLVLETWPDFAADFPAQSFVIDELQKEFIFIGPYASYEESSLSRLQ